MLRFAGFMRTTSAVCRCSCSAPLGTAHSSPRQSAQDHGAIGAKWGATKATLSRGEGVIAYFPASAKEAAISFQQQMELTLKDAPTPERDSIFYRTGDHTAMGVDQKESGSHNANVMRAISEALLKPRLRAASAAMRLSRSSVRL